MWQYKHGNGVGLCAFEFSLCQLCPTVIYFLMAISIRSLQDFSKMYYGPSHEVCHHTCLYSTRAILTENTASYMTHIHKHTSSMCFTESTPYMLSYPTPVNVPLKRNLAAPFFMDVGWTHGHQYENKDGQHCKTVCYAVNGWRNKMWCVSNRMHFI